MRIVSLALVASFAIAGAANAAQQPRRIPAPASPLAGPGYTVPLQTHLGNIFTNQNPGQHSLIIVARCNGTVGPKDLEAWVGANGPVTVQNMVASQSGIERQTITFVVPWGWYYYINVAPQPGASGPPAVCSATAWFAN
jgi:hypothetical protein